MIGASYGTVVVQAGEKGNGRSRLFPVSGLPIGPRIPPEWASLELVGDIRRVMLRSLLCALLRLSCLALTV